MTEIEAILRDDSETSEMLKIRVRESHRAMELLLERNNELTDQMVRLKRALGLWVLVMSLSCGALGYAWRMSQEPGPHFSIDGQMPQEAK